MSNKMTTEQEMIEFMASYVLRGEPIPDNLPEGYDDESINAFCDDVIARFPLTQEEIEKIKIMMRQEYDFKRRAVEWIYSARLNGYIQRHLVMGFLKKLKNGALNE